MSFAEKRYMLYFFLLFVKFKIQAIIKYLISTYWHQFLRQWYRVTLFTLLRFIILNGVIIIQQIPALAKQLLIGVEIKLSSTIQKINATRFRLLFFYLFLRGLTLSILKPARCKVCWWYITFILFLYLSLHHLYVGVEGWYG